MDVPSGYGRPYPLGRSSSRSMFLSGFAPTLATDLTSNPVQKARPSPDKMMARTDGSSRSWAAAPAMASNMGMSRAFILDGRDRMTLRMPSPRDLICTLCSLFVLLLLLWASSSLFDEVDAENSARAKDMLERSGRHRSRNPRRDETAREQCNDLIPKVRLSILLCVVGMPVREVDSADRFVVLDVINDCHRSPYRHWAYLRFWYPGPQGKSRHN